MKPRIKDVAKAAGVSTAMVSRVLTGRGYVRAEKKEKVQKIIQDLGYYPSAFAKGLRDPKTRTLGLIFSWLDAPNLSDYFYQSILGAVLDTAASKDYQLLISNFRGRWDDGGGRHVKAMLQDARVEGILLLAPRIPTSDLNKMLEGERNRVLLLCHTDKAHSYVDSDQKMGMDKALDHLISKGHSRIGLISGELNLVSHAAARHKAYIEGIKARNLPDEPRYIARGRFDAESGAKAVREFAALPKPPTAIIASSDLQAFGAWDLLKAIPKESRPALIGFDDRPDASDRSIGLTTVRQPFAEIARMATQELIHSLDSDLTKRLQITLPVELIKRQTA